MSPKLARGAAGGSRRIVMAMALLAGCGRSDGPRIELVLRGRIVTLDSAHPTAAAVAIGGGRVVALTDSAIPAAWAADRAEVIDLGTATVAPAFTDHHVHLFNVGMALLNARDSGRLGLELAGVGDLDRIESLVRARAQATPPGGWVLGTGWSQAAWGSSALPTAERLSRASPNTPVLLTRTDGHAGWLNAAALAAAGIDVRTPDPPGGTIERGADGRPTGILLERAIELVTTKLPPVSDDDVMTAFRLAADAMAERGVVEVFDAGPLVYPGIVALDLDLGRYYRLLRRVDSIAPLPIEVDLMVPAPSRMADSLLGSKGSLELSPRIRITHLKLFADGALGSRGAALSHPYRDDPATRGIARMTATEIAELATRALDRGLGVATHAIGDGAVNRALDGYQTVLHERSGLAPGKLRIEHFSYASDQDFARAVGLGVILSIQSNFNATPDETPTLGESRVGPDNESRVYAWKRLAGMGARMVEGSDYFAMPGGSMAGVVASLTRKYSIGADLPDSLGRTLAYRANVVRARLDGSIADGAIRVGAPADLVVWSADPFSVPREELPRVRVLRTIGGGRTVFPAAPR